MKTPLLFLPIFALVAAATAPLAHADDTAISKIVGTWQGRGFEVDGAVKITFTTKGDFDLEFEDKDGPIQTHGSYTTDSSHTPWKLVITLSPEGKTIVARTVMALLSDHQLLIQKNEPDQPSPQRFTKDSVILDKMP